MLLKRIWDFMGSRNLSVFIFIMASVCFLVLFIFAFFIPAWWIDNIATLLPYKFLYCLFFINLIICEIKWIPVAIRRCRMVDPNESLDNVERLRCKEIIKDSNFNLRAFAKFLRIRGYKVVEPDKKVKLLYAVKGRLSPVGNILFHVSFLFLLAGIVVSLLFKFEGMAMVTEGYSFSGSRGEYKSISFSPLASIPRLSFALEKLSATFWDENMLFTSLEAELAYGNKREIARLSSPAAIYGTKVTIAGYGYTPMYVLKDRDGKILDRGYVNLNIFIPGSEDHFQIPGYPHQIFVSFFPDYEEREGQLPNRSMNPDNPAYGLKIFRGRLPVFTGVVKQGEWAAFDGMSISFPEFVRWGDFKVVNDSGAIYIWISFVMMGVGLFWKLIFYKRVVIVHRDSEGSLWLAGRFDYYDKLNSLWLKKLSERFRGEVI